MSADPALAPDIGVIVVLAAVVGLVARRLGQPVIVAYVVTGLLLGPAAFEIVAVDQLTETVAELGLAFLLFFLGIKMRIEDIRHIVGPVLEISLPQMFLVAATGTGTALALGFGVSASVLIGLAVMYSSTAVVIKMLKDRGNTTALHGRIAVGVLLVQDVVVVIVLAVLAAGQPDAVSDIFRTLLIVLGLVVAIGVAAVAASRYLLPPLFRRIAGNKDAFFLVALSWGFLFILLAEVLGLSIEMGAFLAGLSIAQLPYSTTLQDRINPLTDLFILVFFVSVGLRLEATDLFAFWQEAIVASAVLIPAKFLIFVVLIGWQGFDAETTVLGSVSMVQVSEFGIVVGAAAAAEGFIDDDVLGFLTLVALTTMSLSTYAIGYGPQLYERLASALEWSETTDSPDDDGGHAVVVGYDDVTGPALPRLAEHYTDIVVVDRDPTHIDRLEDAGYEVVFGDIRRQTVQRAAGVGKAAFVLSSSDRLSVNETLLEETGDDATVIAEASRATDARELYDRGTQYVVMRDHLAGDRLATVLEAYLTDDALFESISESDHDRLRRADTDGPGRIPEPAGGEAGD